MAANRLAVQYLIPLAHTGFHIGVDEALTLPQPPPSPARQARERARVVTDVSGEFAIPELGRWCLQCAGLIDPQQAGWELAPDAQSRVLRQRGYVADTPAPAVGHLDGTVAALAAAEIHNLVHPFRPAGEGRTHRYLVYDALRAELTPLGVTPSETCPVCSPDDGVLGLGDLEPLPDYRREIRLPAVRPVVPPSDESDDSNAEAELQLATPQPRLDGDPAPTAPRPDRRVRARRLPAALDAGLDPDWP